jgi:acetolactate synthase small subunit
MSKIKNYKQVVELSEDLSFVVESDSGTRRLDMYQLIDYFNNVFSDIENDEAKERISSLTEQVNSMVELLNSLNETVDEIKSYIDSVQNSSESEEESRDS